MIFGFALDLQPIKAILVVLTATDRGEIKTGDTGLYGPQRAREAAGRDSHGCAPAHGELRDSGSLLPNCKMGGWGYRRWDGNKGGMGMAYNWSRGKSVRACAADDNGLMPATAFAKWARQWRRFRGCTATDVVASLGPSEWHHTSKFYRATNFYDPRDLRFAAERDALALAIADRREFLRLFDQLAIDGTVQLTTSTGALWCKIRKSDTHMLRELRETAGRRHERL